MRRIVFSIAFLGKKLPAQSTPTSTKSRWKFYTQVRHQSFHTAWFAGTTVRFIPFSRRLRRLAVAQQAAEETAVALARDQVDVAYELGAAIAPLQHDLAAMKSFQ